MIFMSSLANASSSCPHPKLTTPLTWSLGQAGLEHIQLWKLGVSIWDFILLECQVLRKASAGDGEEEYLQFHCGF